MNDKVDNEDEESEPETEPESENESETPVNLDQRMDAAYGPRNNHYNMRPQKPRDYAHKHTNLEDIVMTQYSAKQGIQEFGEKGVKAIMKELQQLHDRRVMDPKD